MPIPREIQRYRDDESIRARAVEEVLRWSSPVAFWTRTTKVDVEMDGITIPKGDRVVSMLRSANRDEDVFEDPFSFDIGRTDNPHVTFGGGGPHHCLGAMLARAEIRAALDELLLRADDISLGPPKVTYPNLSNNMSIFDGMSISLTRSLSHSPFGLVPITPSAARRSRSVSVSPHSSVNTSLLCCPSVGGGRCSQLLHAVRAGRTADTDTDRVRCSDGSGVRRSRGAPVVDCRSPAMAKSPRPPEYRPPRVVRRPWPRPGWRTIARGRHPDCP